MRDSNNNIVITGIGVLSSEGIGIEDFWESVNGSECTDSSSQSCSYIKEIPSFDLRNFLNGLKSPLLSRFSKMGMLACHLAIRDANLDLSNTDLNRVGLILNTDFGANKSVEEYLNSLILKGVEQISPFDFVKTVSNSILGDIARYFQLKGPSSLLIGTSSIYHAFDLLQENRADIIICGGIDELRPLIIETYRKLGLLPENNNNTNNIGPYGNTSGTVLGEAVGFIVLERHEMAVDRNAKVYAKIVDYFINCDTCANELITNRNYNDIVSVIENLINRCSLKPSDIDLILGASTTDKTLGEIELKAISKIWENHNVKVTNIKGYFGECFGAASILNCIIGALCLYHGKIIPCHKSISNISNYRNVNIVSDVINTRKQFCISNSFHIGGNNSSILLSNN